MENTPEWDICIIGGGATGLGTALDAASRGLKTILFERSDFAQGTSSRSTKLIHGGVRYLRQGKTGLVKDALRERGLLLKNAPQLVHDLSFIIPGYSRWEKPFYGAGLKIYDRMAGSFGIGPSEMLSKKETLALLPVLKEPGLRGGVLYHDGQFDDSRLAICIARTAVQHCAVVLNHFPVTAIVKSNSKVCAVQVLDKITGKTYEVKSRIFINATGVFTDEVQAMDEPGHEALLRPSQGIHLVVSSSFLPGKTAIMIPRTSDRRVLFAIPWHGSVVLGTTDTPVDHIAEEPLPFQKEIDLILHDSGKYFQQPPRATDIRSIYTGLRPLVKGNKKKTAALSRDHVITVSGSGLISITGGKWTTYRKMAEDVVNFALGRRGMESVQCRTADLALAGQYEEPFPASVEGSDDGQLSRLVAIAVQRDMCQTVEDFLSRRTRQLVLDAQKAIEMAPRVANSLAEALQRDEKWKMEQIHNFKLVARNYLPRH